MLCDGRKLCVRQPLDTCKRESETTPDNAYNFFTFGQYYHDYTLRREQFLDLSEQVYLYYLKFYHSKSHICIHSNKEHVYIPILI